MYRVSIINLTAYAVEIPSIMDAEEAIQTLIEEGTAVIIVDDLEDLPDLGVKVEVL